MLKKVQPVVLVIAVISGYLLCQIIADVTAVKLVSLWGFTFPAATFIYALSFTMRDLAHKQLGKRATVVLVWAAAIVNILMAAYFIFTIHLPAAPYWELQDAYASVLGFVPRIAMASIIAELVAQLLDTEIYQRVWDRYPKAPQIFRVLASNGVSGPVDSAIFILAAFGGTMPGSVLLGLIWGQTLIKWLLTLVSMPMIYLIPDRPNVELQLVDPGEGVG